MSQELQQELQQGVTECTLVGEGCCEIEAPTNYLHVSVRVLGLLKLVKYRTVESCSSHVLIIGILDFRFRYYTLDVDANIRR